MTSIAATASAAPEMERLQRLFAAVVLFLLVCGASASLVEETDSDADWPSSSSTFSSLSPDDLVDPYTAPPTFNPLTLDLDSFPSFPPSPSSTPLLSPSLHDFFALSLTGGHASTFSMSGLYHTQLQATPSTFTDVYLTILDLTSPDGYYNGTLTLNITCTNGTLTWTAQPALRVVIGDAVISNGSLTFIDVGVEGTVAALNAAMAEFTFTPSSPAFYGNASCPFSVATNTSTPYIDAFVFTVLPVTVILTTNAIRVSFNLSFAPPLTSQYSLYTQLAIDIATVLNTDVDRISVASVTIDPTLNLTSVFIDFLPIPGISLAAGSRVNDTAAALVAAFIALTPAQLADTTWLHYADLSDVRQLCSDGTYRTTCAVAIPIAAAAAAVAVTSSLAFIVGISIASVAVAAAGGIALYRRRRRPHQRPSFSHPSSPAMKAATAELLVDLNPDLPSLLASPDADVQALTDAIAVAIDDHTDPSPAPRRASLALHPSPTLGPHPLPLPRRSLKRSHRAHLGAPKAMDGAERLERDVRERMEAIGGGEGRRWVYQPGVVVTDMRVEGARVRRETFMREMEQGGGERGRGSIVKEAYDGGGMGVSPAQATVSAGPSPPPLGRGSFRYVEGEDSEDEWEGEGPRFVDATNDSAPPFVTAAPQPQVDVADVRLDVGPLLPSQGMKKGGVAAAQGRGSESKAKRSAPGSVVRGMAALDGLHIGYEGGGSTGHSRSPSISTQEVLNDWLNPEEDVDHSTFHPLSSLDLPAPIPAPVLSIPLTLPTLPHPTEGKRKSWGASNAKRASGEGKSQRIVLDLGKAGQPYPGVEAGKGMQGRGQVQGGKGGPGGEVKGWRGVGGVDAPQMKPLMTDAAPHERMSFYQRGVY